MADIELVIKIPEYIYKYIKNCAYVYPEHVEDLALYIIDGTLLPKGHDRLIDVDVLRKELIANEWITDDDGGGLEDILHNSPTIIGADTESENKE